MIDRVVADLGRRLVEVPVGFKWFVDGLVDGSIGFGGEESAGASFLRRDGTVWTTDKDGIIADLLACELTARTGPRPGPGVCGADRAVRGSGLPADRRAGDARAEGGPRRAVAGRRDRHEARRRPDHGHPHERARQRRRRSADSRSSTDQGWFAARPSGTEDVAKVYAESFRGEEHLGRLLEEAQALVASVTT